MPLHLKQKLRKAFKSNGKTAAGTPEGQGSHVRASSLREPGATVNGNASAVQPERNDGTKDLSAGFARLSLGDAVPSQQENHIYSNDEEHSEYPPVGEEDGSTRPRTVHPGYSFLDEDPDPVRPRTAGAASQRSYARSITVGNDDDPYSENVANRNISPPRNWTHSEDTDVEETQLPAVTHETRIVNTHEIVEQRITRDIHTHDVIHRVLPVIDVEVLPPRHFVPSATGDGLVEISADQVPGGSDDAAIQRSIKQALLKEKLQPRSAGAS